VPLEQEVKLAFPDLEAARRAVLDGGAQLVIGRRLIEDRLFDLPDARLRLSGRALRVRRDGLRGYVTVKGPVQAAQVKVREELETGVDDPAVVERQLEVLGFDVCFRSQKYREEYTMGGARLMIDEAVIGVFVEIEATPDEIAAVTSRLGRAPVDYQLESYPTLWRQWCEARGLDQRDMLLTSSADTDRTRG
jgi:predicted adenylyl cyclase CyaB